jgi:hypothetical protein
VSALKTIPLRLYSQRLQSLTLLPSGHARVTHHLGTLCFESVEDLADWLTTGRIPRWASQKFNLPVEFPGEAAETVPIKHAQGCRPC